jgi:hypothetical protein
MSNKGFATDRVMMMDVGADRGTDVDLEGAFILSVVR